MSSDQQTPLFSTQSVVLQILREAMQNLVRTLQMTCGLQEVSISMETKTTSPSMLMQGTLSYGDLKIYVRLEPGS